MTETEWLDGSNVERMFEQVQGRMSDRKRRLFAVACCRRIWPMLTDERCRAAVEVAERYADGAATQRELATIRARVIAAESGTAGGTAYWSVNNRMVDEVVQTVYNLAITAVAHAAVDAVTFLHQEAAYNRATEEATRHVAEDLREVVGNPFRPARLDPHWLAWGNRAVVHIARDIYEGRRFEETPILADALEDAGCDDVELLQHCRRHDGHVRGCWAVDLVLGLQ